MTLQDIIKKAGFKQTNYPAVKPVRIYHVEVSDVKCTKKCDHVKIIGEQTRYKVIRIDKKNSILHLQEL